jgi:hypothetical protein
MSTESEVLCLEERLSLSLSLEECLELLWEEDLCDDDDDLWDLLDPSDGTSRMFNSRPVVGSTVDVTLGLCAQW